MRAALVCVLAACGASKQDGGDAAMREVGRIALPGVGGRIDHLAYDAESGRLFVCALGNGTLEVVDVAAGRVVKTIAKLDEPQGVAGLPAQRQLAVATGGDGRLHVFDLASLAEVKTVEAGGDADNVRFDEARGELWVGCEEGIALFDVKSWQRVAMVKLDGHAESFQLERGGARLFVNVPSARQVAVVDRVKREVVATWPLEHASSNFPMALDPEGGRLYVGCRSPAQLLVFDTKSGEVVARAPIGGDCDDLFVDPARARLYASCGEGCVSVVSIESDGVPKPGAKIDTADGARTSLFVASLKSLFVVAPRRGGDEARLIVFVARD